MNTELLNYISAQRSVGTPPDVIRVNLHMMGKWTEEEVAQAMQSPVAPVVPTPQTVPVQQPVSEPILSASTGTHSNLIYRDVKIAVSALVVLLVLGGAYYVWGSNLMVGNKYEEDNILSGMIAKYADIHSSTYTSSISINMVERDRDAKPLLPEEAVVDDYYSFDLISFLPRDLKLNGYFSMSADWQDKDLANWKFNMGGDGDLGDLTYKIDLDGIQKDGQMYIKINNLPIIPFIGDMSVLKGQWIKVGDSLSRPQDLFGFPGYPSSSDSKTYKETHDEVVVFLTRAATLSDKNHLLKISDSSKVEMDGRNLTRYEVTLRKEAILPIYEKLKEDYELSTNTSIASYFDGDTSEYLASQRFSDVFDYWDKNASLALYVDQEGNPAVVEYKMRVVPPDTETQLKDRQANIVFRLTISNINKKVDIEVPDGAKSFEEAISGTSMGDSLSSARASGNDAKIKANLAGLRTSAEIYYDNNNGYGVSANSCSSGMFADTSSGMNSYIDALPPPPDTQCHSNGVNYAVTASLTDGYWCVDSQGASLAKTAPLATGKISCQ